MPVYEYKALNAEGRAVSGIINADNATVARQKLRGSEVFPIEVRESRHVEGKGISGRFAALRFFARIKPAHLAVMTKQLATLIGSGFPLVSALDAVISQTPSRVFKSVLAQVKESIIEGKGFADSLSLFPAVFPEIYVNMVHAGESSGTLEVVLNRLADILEKQQSLNSRIRAAMAYPIMMTFVGILVLFFLLTYVVPNITAVFADMNQTLPLPTRLLIRTTHALQNYWLFALGLILIVAALLHSFSKRPGGRHLMDRLYFAMPISGRLLKKTATARFSRTLGSLLENGVSLTNALNVVENITGNSLYAKAVAVAGREVAKGKDLEASLAVSRVFPELALQMIKVGEQSGELEAMLLKIADAYDTEVEMQIVAMTSLLEPLMILIMGVVVGAIVISICLPIFEMNQLVM